MDVQILTTLNLKANKKVKQTRTSFSDVMINGDRKTSYKPLLDHGTKDALKYGPEESVSLCHFSTIPKLSFNLVNDVCQTDLSQPLEALFYQQTHQHAQALPPR